LTACLRHVVLALVAATLGGCAATPLQRGATAAPEPRKPRVIVTTDPELTRHRRIIVSVTP
jgi:type IV pilus biogenesis protein CpaD/CtpE